MGALDLIVQEGVLVLGQVEALQPVCYIVLGPQEDRLGGEGLVGDGLDEGEWGGRAAPPGAQAEALATQRGRGEPEHIRQGRGGGRGRGGQGGGPARARVRWGRHGAGGPVLRGHAVRLAARRVGARPRGEGDHGVSLSG